MSNKVIHTENLGKRYKLGETFDRNRTFREAIMEFPVTVYRKLTSQKILPKKKWEDPETPPDTFWALRDINIDIDHGDVVGIIGPNGAGKSTLLKVLSKITYPTKGFARINGRVGSLLEVGTGFHIELTGRENIYLNGSIIGMRKHEIDRKFDEIVEFAGVEKFLDTPIKRFSSGMTVRLAFSVAAHLEPEILIVDEVLAVGDASFQKKCLGKMEDVSKEGRTVLFVSHNMAAVQNLCRHGILLSKGKIVNEGPIAGVINNYITSLDEYLQMQSLEDRKDRIDGKKFRFKEVEMYDKKTADKLQIATSGQDIEFRIKCENKTDRTMKEVVVSIAFFTSMNSFLFACRSDAIGQTFDLPPGIHELNCTIPRFPTNRGRYYYNLIAFERGERLDWIKQAGYVDVETGDFYKTGKVPAEKYQGVFVDFNWEKP